MLVLMYNMCARMVGINQILNTCMKHLNPNANTHMFSFDYLYRTHHLGMGGPIGREEGGTSRLIKYNSTN
jgi:hypothetical protein